MSKICQIYVKNMSNLCQNIILFYRERSNVRMKTYKYKKKNSFFFKKENQKESYTS